MTPLDFRSALAETLGLLETARSNEQGYGDCLHYHCLGSDTTLRVRAIRRSLQGHELTAQSQKPLGENQ